MLEINPKQNSEINLELKQTFYSFAQFERFGSFLRLKMNRRRRLNKIYGRLIEIDRLDQCGY